MKRSHFSPPGFFKLPIDEWASGLPQAGGAAAGGGEGERALGWEEDVWFTFKMSPRSRPVVRSKATLMQQKLPFLKHIYGFPANYPRFSLGKVFRSASSDIYPHHPVFSFDGADSVLSVFCFFLVFFLCYDCKTLLLPQHNCLYEIKLVI